MKKYLLLLLAFLALEQRANPIDSLLADIERNNPSLRVFSISQEADLLGTKAENNLPETSVEYSPFFNKDANGIAASEMIVAQEFDFPTLYAQRNKAVRMKQRSQDLQYRSLRREVLCEARLACLDVISLNKRHELLQQRQAVFQKLLAGYEAKFREEAVTLVELNSLKMENMALQTEMADCSKERAGVLNRLKLLNGNRPVTLTLTEYPTLPVLTDSANLMAELIAGDVSLQGAEAEVESMRQNVKIAKHNQLPKIKVGYRRNTEGKDANNGFLVGVAIPLFSQRHRTKEARLRQQGQELEYLQQRQQTEAELQNLMTELHFSRQALKAYDYPLMKSTLLSLDKALEAGQISVIDYCNGADEVFQRMNEYFEQENKYQKTLCTLLKNRL